MSNKRKRHLDPEQLKRTVKAVAQEAAAQGVAVALVGGCAMQVYGSDRLTGDVDVITDDARAFRWPSVRRLSFGGHVARAPNGVEVDLIDRTDHYMVLYEAALVDARRRRGVPIRVVSPGYLAAMKMAAARPKDEADLLVLLASGKLTHRTRALIAKHLGPYAADEWDRLVEEASWRKRTGRL